MAENMKASTFTDANGNTVEVVYAQAVRITKQTLTEEQKAQVRDNIGAISNEKLKESVKDFESFLQKNDFLEDGDSDAKTNILTGNYTEDEFVIGASITAEGGYVSNQYTKNYVITPPIPIEGGKKYAVLTTGINNTPLQDALLATVNDGYCLFGSDGTTIVKKTFCSNIGNNIFVFEAPLSAAFVRFCLAYKNDDYTFDFVKAFNAWVMIEGDENTTLEDFENIRAESVGAISEIHRVDGSAVEIADKKAREKINTIKTLEGKTIVNFGDSIYGNANAPTDISSHLAELTGATVHNCGFGGCRMGTHSSEYFAPFSMFKIADAIISGDFTEQEQALENAISSGQTGVLVTKFPSTLELLKSIDFSKVDVITIAYGTNDYLGNNALDNQDNPYDTATFGGALRDSVEKLLGAYPNLRIFIVSLTYLFFMDSNYNFVDDSGTHTNSLGKLLGDYNDTSEAIADEYNLPYINNYEIGMNKFNRSLYFPAKDGVHHNENGRKVIAAHLAKNLW